MATAPWMFPPPPAPVVGQLITWRWLAGVLRGGSSSSKPCQLLYLVESVVLLDLAHLYAHMGAHVLLSSCSVPGRC